MARRMCITSTCPHSFLVGSLSLLLVFRTNSSYQRYREGLKIWENVTSISRNLSRNVNLYGKEIGLEKKDLIFRLLVAFPDSLRLHIQDFITSNQKNDIDNPIRICNNVAKVISEVPYGPTYSSREKLSFLSQIDKLSNAVGECERIHQTEVPHYYAHHALRSLTFWLLTLPFVLMKDFGYVVGPAMGIISWVMFGVYQIGHMIEDPFQGTLKLNEFCETIKSDVSTHFYDSDSAFSDETTTTNHLFDDDNESAFNLQKPIDQFDIQKMDYVLSKYIQNIPEAENCKQKVQKP